jgi:hypothetical protein
MKFQPIARVFGMQIVPLQTQKMGGYLGEESGGKFNGPSKSLPASVGPSKKLGRKALHHPFFPNKGRQGRVACVRAVNLTTDACGCQGVGCYWSRFNCTACPTVVIHHVSRFNLNNIPGCVFNLVHRSNNSS